jgi:hypothetical protein
MDFNEETKQVVWEKASVVKNSDPNVLRKDECGAWIKHSEYGNRNSLYGWGIDNITSRDHGGEDIPINLRLLHWLNNAARGTDPLKCVITADSQDTTKITAETLSELKY